MESTTTDHVAPCNAIGAKRDAAIDLGSSSTRFNRGYFSATVFAAGIGGISDDNTYIDFPGSDRIKFFTGGSERMRIDDDDILFGTSSTSLSDAGIKFANTSATHKYAVFTHTASSANESLLYINRQSSDGTAIFFRRANTNVGSISVTSSGTTYNTTSDLRLKQDIEPLVATDKLMAMNPVSYSWKADPDGPRSMGFIAQEMQEIMPEAVSTGDDDDMMSMDYGRITPILVSALQDAHRKIEQLEQRIAEMESK